MSRTLKIIIGILFHPYGIYLIVQYLRHGNKEKRDLKTKEEQNKRVIERQKKEEPFREKISNLFDEIGTFNVTETNDFVLGIKKNEDKIIDFGDNKLLKDFLKLNKFMSKLEEEIQTQFNNIPQLTDKIFLLDDKDKMVLNYFGGKKDFSSSSIDDFYRSLRKKKINLESLINYHLNFFKTSSILMSLLLEGNKTDFYFVYDKFEEIGVFRSNFENELLNKLDNLNVRLDILTNQLVKLNNSVNFQNLLLTINTFQLRSMNKKLGN